MFSGAKIIKKYCINSNNPTILYKVVGLLYETRFIQCDIAKDTYSVLSNTGRIKQNVLR